MNNDIKFDHFKDLEELKRNVECWIAEDEMYWERWFGLRDIKTLLDYITNLQEQLHQASLDIQELTERDIMCPTSCEKLTNLQEENKRLKEIVENITTLTVCGDRKQIKNTAQYKLDIAQDKIEKAIEYIKSINKRMYKDDYGTFFSTEDLLNILQGEDNE